MTEMPTRIGPKHPRRIYLRHWREYHGLTQQQVADRIGQEGTTGATISRWENGKRKPNDQAYAEALGEPVERLYTLPPAREPGDRPNRPSGADKELRSLIAEVAAEVLRRRNVRR